MIRLDRDIQSLTDFKRRTSDFVKQIKESKSPLVLTVNGKAELVVQDAESYQELLDAVERSEMISSVRRGLAQMQRGEGVPFDEAFRDLRDRLKNSNG